MYVRTSVRPPYRICAYAPNTRMYARVHIQSYFATAMCALKRWLYNRQQSRNRELQEERTEEDTVAARILARCQQQQSRNRELQEERTAEDTVAARVLLGSSRIESANEREG